MQNEKKELGQEVQGWIANFSFGFNSSCLMKKMERQIVAEQPLLCP